MERRLLVIAQIVGILDAEVKELLFVVLPERIGEGTMCQLEKAANIVLKRFLRFATKRKLLTVALPN